MPYYGTHMADKSHAKIMAGRAKARAPRNVNLNVRLPAALAAKVRAAAEADYRPVSSYLRMRLEELLAAESEK